MSSNIDVSGYQSDRYFARSWALITQEKGWWKPVLICAVASLVPVVGPIAVLGYALEWSRRVAWGSTEAPTRNVKVGELIRSGWRGAVVIGGWSIANFLVGWALGEIPFLGDLLGFVWGVIGLLLGMAFMVAAVRATIYQDFKAGYRVNTLYQMTTEDPWGLMRIWVIKLVFYVVESVVALAVLIPAFVGSITWIMRLVELLEDYSYYGMYSYDTMYVVDIVMAIIDKFMPALLLTLVVSLMIGALANLVLYGAIGLWMRRFDVERWGRDEAPLPERIIAQGPAERPATPERPVAPVAPAAPVEPVAPAAQVTPEQQRPGEDAVPESAAQQQPVEDAPTASEPVHTEPEPAPAEPPAQEEPPVPADEPADEPEENDEPPIPGKGNKGNDDDFGEVISIEPIAVAPIELPPTPDSTDSDTPSE